MSEPKRPIVERRFWVQLRHGREGDFLTEEEASELLGQLIRELRAKASNYTWEDDAS